MNQDEIRDWEDVLNAYLEGRGLRADAEELLMRLHLSGEDRAEIERSLRLADEVRAAVRQPTPRIEFEGRLTEALAACPAPAAMPAWRLEGGEFAATGAVELEDEDEEDPETIDAIRGELAVPEPDAGMAGRLRDKLRAFINSEEGELDEKVAERLMGGRRQVRRDADVPDVLAAEEEPPEG